MTRINHPTIAAGFINVRQRRGERIADTIARAEHDYPHHLCAITPLPMTHGRGGRLAHLTA